MTRGRRVQTTTLRRVNLGGQPAFVSALVTQVPDIATGEMVTRRWHAIHFFGRRYWNRIELHDERAGNYAPAR